jgi:hypothetical protein
VSKEVFESILFSGHAIKRMFQRRISKEQVTSILQDGEIIYDYPDDEPYPSKLILGFIDKIPIHVVVAEIVDSNTAIVITAYVPDLSLWEEDYRCRRKP